MSKDDLNVNSILVTKIKDEEIEYAQTKDLKYILNYNFTVKQLKSIGNHHQIKLRGNKHKMHTEIVVYLTRSIHAIKIQKLLRGYLNRIYISLKGKAFKNKKICNNETDFCTFEDIISLNIDDFYSYEDISNFVYGFSVKSMISLISNSDKNKVMNPYNRCIIPIEVLKNFERMVSIGKSLKRIIPKKRIIKRIIHAQPTEELHLQCRELFFEMDFYGHFTNPNWYLTLSSGKLRSFIRELADIWNYRAQLSAEVKLDIVPEGDPFSLVNISQLITLTHEQLQLTILSVCNKLIRSGRDHSNRSLGVLFVLSALTLVSTDAAVSIPWLFESVQIN